MVAFKKGLKKVFVQEVEDVVQCTRSNLHSNNCDDVTVISALWGSNFLSESEKLGMLFKFDMIVMADVLYHEEHMSDLMESILHSMASTCKIIICCEQRRKDLNKLFFDELSTRLNTFSIESIQFSVAKWLVYTYAIEQANEDLSTEMDSNIAPTVQFHLHLIEVISSESSSE